MPTPVTAARQCLTEEAARALDEAMAVARRRSHAQTTSLHAVSALLALPSSTLRDACSRARSCAYSPRLQFRALELCVGVSLDRLPSSKGVENPPVSNSLMAAIKRSQANQRRQPETFHLYQQMQQQNQNQSSISCVKVELKHFILSILDDPIVSRLFGEAGFRSCDIKIAIVNPPPISRFSRSRCPPKFLFNLTDSDPSRRNFNFPFPCESVDENCRRIGEILVKKKGKNPLLIGVCSKDALTNFTECVQSGRTFNLPAEIHGLNVICIQKEISEFVAKGGSVEIMESKFKELKHMVELCSYPGIVVIYGGLNVFVDDDGVVGPVSYVVSQLTALMEAHGDKLWLMGSAGTYETYTKFIARFHSIDRDWDLNLLPITSSPSIGDLYSKSSLMGSFVPLGGFFPTTSEIKYASNSTNNESLTTHCNMCHEKYVQEVSVMLKEGSSSNSLADQYWLQSADCNNNTSKRFDMARDDRTVLNANVVVGLQRKWNDICNRLHRNKPFQPNISQAVSQTPGVEGFQLVAKDLQKISKADNANSQSCVTSVTTDLGLGTLYASSNGEQQQRRKTLSGSISAEFDDNNLNQISQSSPLSVTKMGAQFDPTDFKTLWRVLSTKVGWQEEAVHTVCQSVSRCRQGNGRRSSNYRGDIWLCLLGPDRVGKRKIAVGLAEFIFGSKECLISVDLSSEDGISRSNSIFDDQDLNGYDDKLRGKTVVDYIAQELSKKPRSVVLLENIDKSDFVAQNSLSQAITTGKFPNSHGREISVNNMIFIVTSTITKVDKKVTNFSEERILEAKGRKMQIVIESIAGDVNRIGNTNVSIMPKKGLFSNPFPNKRKVTGEQEKAHKTLKTCLDLNLPVEEMEEYDSDSASENSKAWLEDFFEKVDQEVNLKPFDFDALAEKVLRKVCSSFQKIAGSETVLLGIEEEVMVQILAASWLSNKNSSMEDWVEQVLSPSLEEAKQRYHLNGQQMVKLVADCGEGCPVEDQVPGICLPARITVN